MAETTTDILIIGGGIMGCATADALVRAGFDGSIVVVERDPALSQGSTGRSAGGVRLQFSTPENIRMSQVTLDLLADLEGRFGPGSDVGFRENGYLLLATEAGRPTLLENAAIQKREGAKTQILGPSELAARFPWLDSSGIAAGTFGPKGEGWLDPASLHGLFRKSALDGGVKIEAGNVVGIARQSNGGWNIDLENGHSIACGIVVNAAGAWAGSIAAHAGMELPVVPRKRFVFVIDCRKPAPGLSAAPLTVDPSGIYFRPEGSVFICGKSPTEDEEPAPEDLDAVDHDWFENEIWPKLAARVPAFEAVKVVNSWAGYYDDNTLDHNAIIGPHPEHDSFMFINGFSGHGIQQAAAAGRALAELVTAGRFETLDLTRFGYDRIARNTPLRERNVI